MDRRRHTEPRTTPVQIRPIRVIVQDISDVLNLSPELSTKFSIPSYEDNLTIIESLRVKNSPKDSFSLPNDPYRLSSKF